MDHESRAELVAQELDRARPDWDDAAWACVWSEVARLAAEGLAETGVHVVRDESRADVSEELQPLRYGWASTPGEVHDWAREHGLPLSWENGKAVLRFEESPGEEVLAVLKAKSPLYPGQESRGKDNGSGWSYVKSGRRWECKCFGLYSTSGKVAAFREAIDAGEISYAGEVEEEAAEGGAW